MNDATDIAIIVPVHDDAAALRELLALIDTWRTRPAELIVVADGDDAALRAHCEQRGWRWLDAAGTRGRRLDHGARASAANALWFLHADAHPPAEGPAAIAAAVGGGAHGGCFRFRFQGARRWYKRLLESLIALRIRCGGIAYGDQGLFVTRAAYVEIGGFTDQPLFEEVPLVRGLRARRGFRMLDLPMLVSTRRWERDGWARRTLHNRWLALAHSLGVPPARLALAYHRPLRQRKEARP